MFAIAPAVARAADVLAAAAVQAQGHGRVAVEVGRRQVVRRRDAPLSVRQPADGEVLGVRVSIAGEVCEHKLAEQGEGCHGLGPTELRERLDHGLRRNAEPGSAVGSASPICTIEPIQPTKAPLSAQINDICMIV
jgi:hypothetical protein